MKIKRKTTFRDTMAARRWVWLAASLCAVMILPWQAKAVTPTPPLTMKAAFDNPSPQLGSSETLRVTLTTTKAYANLAIAVNLPEEVALVSGKPEFKGALNAGEKREIVLKVMLKTTGRYTVRVDATFDPAESPLFSSSAINLNIIAEDHGVVASMDPFDLIDLKRAKTPAEKNRLRGIRGIETQTPAPTGTPPPVPSFLLPADQKEKPAAPQKPESRLGDSISVRVFGIMKYKDTAGVEHPIRFAKVKVFDIDLVGEELMGEGNTLVDGTYSIDCSGGDIGSGPDIVVRVYTAIMNDAVASVGDTKTTIYYMESAENTDFTGSTLGVSLTTGTPVRNSASDDVSARRFSVLDATLQFAAEALYLRNLNLLPKVSVIYPVAGIGAYYEPSDVTINIPRNAALDWDVIGHEYGHFLADKGSSSRFDTSEGGAHDGSSTIPSNGKEKGVRLAWSEGWATFFEIMALIKPTQTLLALPGVPNSGDRVYQNTELNVITWDAETVGMGALGSGYASECSVLSMLYDFCDADADTSNDGLSNDNVNIAPKLIWNLLNTGNMDDVGKFYNALGGAVGYDIATILYFSPLFAMNNIGPELDSPSVGTVVSSVISPEFKWKANGDSTAGFAHDKFDLIIAKNNFTELVGIKENIADTKYTFTDAEWQAITAQSDDTGEFQWAVTGYNSVNPRMPAASGLGKFVSNTQTFKLRSYHIRLTWTTFGADVDLHFTNPSGSDCYYNNRNPDWGVVGDTTDNPSLDRDCITSCTEENITVDKVVDPGTYQVWVHYFSDHGKGATTATIEIYKYGRLLSTSSQGLSETGDRWNVFDFSIGATLGMDVIAEHPGAIIHGVTSPAPKAPEE